MLQISTLQVRILQTVYCRFFRQHTAGQDATDSILQVITDRDTAGIMYRLPGFDPIEWPAGNILAKNCFVLAL
jgi:hypothetical protein